MAATAKLEDMVAGVEHELRNKLAEIKALEIQVNVLRSHKQEAEQWLATNWQKYSAAKVEFEGMKAKCRELAAGMTAAGV